VNFLTAEQVLFIHSRLIDSTGGAHGVRDTGLLKSAVARLEATFEGKDLYPDIFHKTAALMESLARNHPFIDGNKRTAITAAGIFLRLNGHLFTASQIDLEKFTLRVAMGKVSLQAAAKWFREKSKPV